VVVVTMLIFRDVHLLQVSARSKSRHGHSTCARPFPVPKKIQAGVHTRSKKNNGALRGVWRPCRSRVSPPFRFPDHCISPPIPPSSTLGTMSYSIDDAWGPQPFLSPPAPPPPPQLVASARATAAGVDDDDGDGGTDAPSASSSASPSSSSSDEHHLLLAELRLLRQQGIRQTYAVLALLALHGALLFFYLDRMQTALRSSSPSSSSSSARRR